jgi:hypothetical protein
MAYAAEDQEALERGLYAKQFKRYLAHFPRERFLILVYEEIFRDVGATASALSRIAHFLGVREDGFDSGLANEPIGRDVSSGRPRLARAYGVAKAVRRWLMRKDMEGPVRLAKRWGVSKRIFGRPVPPPDLKFADRQRLWQWYEPDVVELESLLGKSFDLWRGYR